MNTPASPTRVIRTATTLPTAQPSPNAEPTADDLPLPPDDAAGGEPPPDEQKRRGRRPRKPQGITSIALPDNDTLAGLGVTMVVAKALGTDPSSAIELMRSAVKAYDSFNAPAAEAE